jgi:hypothetical protein
MGRSARLTGFCAGSEAGHAARTSAAKHERIFTNFCILAFQDEEGRDGSAVAARRVCFFSFIGTGKARLRRYGQIVSGLGLPGYLEGTYY